MLVKSLKFEDHIGHLRSCFDILNRYGIKHNPAKCTFGLTSREFLGYIITRRGIEVNPKQITTIADLPSPKNKRKFQRLTVKIVALHHFIFRSTNQCLPFYQMLRTNRKFEWEDKCEEAFKQLKEYITTPPVLSKPEQGKTLYFYVLVSAAAVSGVFVYEDRGDQKPNFYIKSLDGA